jgi:hypothetical protein
MVIPITERELARSTMMEAVTGIFGSYNELVYETTSN